MEVRSCHADLLVSCSAHDKHFVSRLMARLCTRLRLEQHRAQLDEAEKQLKTQASFLEDVEVVIHELAAAGVFVHFATLGAKEQNDSAHLKQLWAALQPYTAKFVSTCTVDEARGSSKDAEIEAIVRKSELMSDILASGEDVTTGWKIYLSICDSIFRPVSKVEDEVLVSPATSPAFANFSF